MRAKVRGVAEAAKKKLSEAESVVIRIPAGGGIEATLTRQMFEGLTLDLFRRARTPLDQACWQVRVAGAGRCGGEGAGAGWLAGWTSCCGPPVLLLRLDSTTP